MGYGYHSHFTGGKGRTERTTPPGHHVLSDEAGTESTSKPSAPTWGWTPPAHAPPGPGWKACPDGYLALEFTSPLCNLSFSKTHNLINVLHQPNNLPCRLTPGCDTLICSPRSSLWFSTFHLFLQIPPMQNYSACSSSQTTTAPPRRVPPNLSGTQFNCHLFLQVPTAPCTYPCSIYYIARDCPPAWAILDWSNCPSIKNKLKKTLAVYHLKMVWLIFTLLLKFFKQRGCSSIYLIKDDYLNDRLKFWI